jgi:hypothetical protein
VDGAGRVLRTRDHRLRRPPGPPGPRPLTIATVGASMNAGKTTTCAMAVRGLVASGMKVVAAKVTGTGANKDLQFMRDAGASLVLDFTDCGWPSTYRLSARRLLGVLRTLTARLAQERPDAVVLEIADGIFQRETAMLLQAPELREHVDHVLFAAVDAASAESGLHVLRERGLDVLGFSGLASSSALGRLEVERATGVPCLSSRELAEGGMRALIAGRRKLHARRLAPSLPDYAPAPS